jgi:hypothetical protein
MQLIITHKKTKRIIEGPFSMCCGRKQLEELKSIIDTTLEGDFHYGWINVDEDEITPEDKDFNYVRRQKSIDQTKASPWD